MKINKITKIFIAVLIISAAILDTQAALIPKANSTDKQEFSADYVLRGDTIQQRIINKNLERKDYKFSYDWLAMLSIQAFSKWALDSIAPGCKIVVFNIPGAEIDMDSNDLYKQETGRQYPESYRGAELKLKLNKEYVDALPFESYPQYTCCDYASLLSGKYIPVIVTYSSYNWLCCGTHVAISALIPENNDPLTFRAFDFEYIYLLMLDPDNGKPMSQYEPIEKLDRKLNNGEISPEQWMTQYQNLDIYRWNLEELRQYNYDSVTFNAENMPTSVFELFGTFPYVQRIKKTLEYNPLDKFDPNDDSDDFDDE